MRQNPQWMDDSDVATGTKFPSLMYRTSISFPFAGIGGPERAMIEANWPFIAKNVIDNAKVLRPVLQDVEDLRKLKFGGPREIIRTRAFERYASCDPTVGIFSTSPCQDFALQGPLAGLEGLRGSLFMDQLKWSAAMIAKGKESGNRTLWVCFEMVEAFVYEI